MAVGSATGSSGYVVPPLAQLLDCTVTCDAGVSDTGSSSTNGSSDGTPFVTSGPAVGPWDCIAVTVSDSAGLAALPDLWAGAAGSDGASLFVTVEAFAAVRMDISSWRPLWVGAGSTVVFLGRGRAASKLDLSGAGRDQLAVVDSDLTSQGLVVMYDLTLMGLAYPKPADDVCGLMSAWLHAVGIPGKRFSESTLGVQTGRISPEVVMVRLDGVRLAVADAEAEWWRNAAPIEAGGAGLDLAPGGLWSGPNAVLGSGGFSDSGMPAGGSTGGDAATDVGPNPIQQGDDQRVPVKKWELLAEEGSSSNSSIDAQMQQTPAPATSWATWPLAESVGLEVAKQLPLRNVRLPIVLGALTGSPYAALATICTEAEAAGGSTAAAGVMYFMPHTAPDLVYQRGGGSRTFETRLRRGTDLGPNMLPLAGIMPEQSEAPVVWLGDQPHPGARCVLLPVPPVQSNPGPATWDMMDLSDRIRIRVGAAGSDSDGPSLQIQGFTLYNLSPYAQPQPPEPPQPLQPQLLPPSPPAVPPSSPAQLQEQPESPAVQGPSAARAAIAPNPSSSVPPAPAST
ncbi:hypothetical protein HXX76_004176 [Chlamydomonas incerta]|uniref:Uncharacterized protein n=1 Tax=Chlamydomonas incerta TaxID=51695 RepID=A0A835T6Y2_CHLIN|nr:hypothetical protein HXX76_004176 [Chlamydomonas incerta]|eukprot:KAG2440062.1 hypothetical protein HXX76_004176 [Chlamydomonas incerta]